MSLGCVLPGVLMDLSCSMNWRPGGMSMVHRGGRYPESFFFCFRATQRLANSATQHHAIQFYYRLRSNGANQPADGNLQNRPCFFLRWLSWAFCYSNGKLTNVVFSILFLSIHLWSLQWQVLEESSRLTKDWRYYQTWETQLGTQPPVLNKSVRKAKLKVENRKEDLLNSHIGKKDKETSKPSSPSLGSRSEIKV